MQKTTRPPIPLIVACVALAAVIATMMAVRDWRRRHHHVDPAASAVAGTQPAKPALPHAQTHPATSLRDSDYLEIIRTVYPEFPVVGQLEAPLELSQAAHLKLQDPIYLGGQGRIEMWITRRDAPLIGAVLKDAVDEEKDVDVHVLRERVAFVHWMPADNRTWPPYLVCRTSTGGYEVISADHGRQPLPNGHAYRWESAMSWNEKIVVPSGHGVSIFHFAPEVVESYHELAAGKNAAADSDDSYAEPRFLLDAQGLLAWLPWEAGKTGGNGAARYVEPPTDDATGKSPPGSWVDLSPAKGWPAKILHLVPLLDGTVLMLAVDDQGAVQLQFNTLEHATVKEEDISTLVDQLADADQAVRDAAYGKLSQYGSGIWPILEKLLPDQGPEAQLRMRQLLKQKVSPTLNGMALLGSKNLKLADRLSDGGTVFFADAGVSIPNPDDPDAGPNFRVPAWISIRPGRPIELLPEIFTADLTPGESRLYVNGNDWIVSNDVRGPRRFVGNGFVTLLRKSEHPFSEFVGVDRRGRWLFRKPPATDSSGGLVTPPLSSTAPTTTPSPINPPATEPRPLDSGATAPSINRHATAAAATVLPGAGEQTLIIDPTLPDPIPRLPVWVINTADQVGWTKADWPVTKKTSAYALKEHGWELLADDDTLFTKPEDVPPPVEPAPTPPSTVPATATTTAQLPSTAPTSTTAEARATHPSTTAPDSPRPVTPLPSSTTPAGKESTQAPILTDRQGTKYFGGLTDLRVVRREGPSILWPLPAKAIGEGPAWLVKTRDGRLFLFNQPGRVLRLQPTPASAEPFKLEAVFTHNIPAAHHPTRIWLDPAGRIDMEWESQLAIFFPAGYIPPGIAEMMMLNGTDEMDQ